MKSGESVTAGKWVRCGPSIQLTVFAREEPMSAVVPSRFRFVFRPIRNAEMLRLKPDLVLAFPGGSGTANMIKLARASGVKVERA